MNRGARANVLEVPGAEPDSYNRTLFEALLDARARRGGGTLAVEDAERQPLTLGRLVLGACVLGAQIARFTAPAERVGVFLPNSNGLAVVFFALQAQGRVPAMLNFSTGVRNVSAACATAEVRTVLTSRRFVQLAQLEDQISALEKQVRIVWLEDVRERIGTMDKIRGVLASRSAGKRHRKLGVTPDDAAVILFTSGTEGEPKGVVLSHRAILANCEQVLQVFDFTGNDVMFNALPVFHSFGLTAGLILPLYAGFRVFLYPSPLHYKQIPPLIRDSQASIMLATDSFAQGWARSAASGDLSGLRLAVLGAERVKPQTRDLFRARFGLELHEGYGVTETAPVLAVNTFKDAREGTVGKLLPGIEHRIDPVPGLNRGGRLLVRGPNIMSGYLNASEPGLLRPPAEGWHDTGDIVEMDEDGFITIKGRARRFAKIGGEMVSLAAVEACAATLWPDNMHAVVALEDARKGEQLIMVTDCAAASRQALLGWAKQNGVAELMLPRQIVHVEAVPVTGTGKLDYQAVERLAREAGAGSGASSS